MRQLIIGGDSFTYGSELKGKPWAEQLGDRLGYVNVNVAEEGIGNASIARNVISALTDDCAVAVMWTFATRFDFYHGNKWETSTILDNSKFSETFFKHIGNSEYYELHNTFTNILLLQHFLEKKNVPYIFTSADNNWGKLHSMRHAWLTKLFNLVDWGHWYFIDDGNGFYRWGKENFAHTSSGHPLDIAHEVLVKNIMPTAERLIGFAD